MAGSAGHSLSVPAAFPTPRISLGKSKTPVTASRLVLVGGGVRVRAGRSTGVGRVGGYTGGGVLPSHPPVSPVIGIARTQPVPMPGICAHHGHSRVPPGPFRTPVAPRTQYASLGQYRRDLALNILKLVINLECRRF